jgi:hypothetical protein
MTDLLRRNRPLLIGAPLAGLLLGLAASALMPARHEAEAVVRIGLTAVLPSVNTAPIEPAAALVERVRSAAFRQQLGERLNQPVGEGLLSRGNRLRARAVGGAPMVALTGTGPDSESARALVTQAVALVAEQHTREAEPVRSFYQSLLEGRRREIAALEQQLALMGAPADLRDEGSRATRADSLIVSSTIATMRVRLAEAMRDAELVAAVADLPTTQPTRLIAGPALSGDPSQRPAWLVPLAGMLAGLVVGFAVAIARSPRAA